VGGGRRGGATGNSLCNILQFQEDDNDHEDNRDDDHDDDK
jgi:hypothetical protein